MMPRSGSKDCDLSGLGSSELDCFHETFLFKRVYCDNMPQSPSKDWTEYGEICLNVPLGKGMHETRLENVK